MSLFSYYECILRAIFFIGKNENFIESLKKIIMFAQIIDCYGYTLEPHNLCFALRKLTHAINGDFSSVKIENFIGRNEILIFLIKTLSVGTR